MVGLTAYAKDGLMSLPVSVPWCQSTDVCCLTVCRFYWERKAFSLVVDLWSSPLKLASFDRIDGRARGEEKWALKCASGTKYIASAHKWLVASKSEHVHLIFFLSVRVVIWKRLQSSPSFSSMKSKELWVWEGLFNLFSQQSRKCRR